MNEKQPVNDNSNPPKVVAPPHGQSLDGRPLLLLLLLLLCAVHDLQRAIHR